MIAKLVVVIYSFLVFTFLEGMKCALIGRLLKAYGGDFLKFSKCLFKKGCYDLKKWFWSNAVSTSKK